MNEGPITIKPKAPAAQDLEVRAVWFAQDIKVLSLCFIDEVAKYRDYTREDTLGDYAYRSPDHHGTPRQRERELGVGFRTGDATTCAIPTPRSRRAGGR